MQAVSNLLDVNAVIIGGAIWERVGDRFLDVIRPIISQNSTARQLHV